jgi:hypothetical protein
VKIQTVFPVLFCALLLAACGLSPVPATATATIAPTFTATLPVPTPDLSRDTYPGEDIHQTNSNAIGLSPEALALLNNSGFMVVTVNGGSDNPNIVSWCGNDDTCRVSPTPELFIPGGSLDLNMGIDANGFVNFRMADGSVQKGLVELPKVDGAIWVWGIHQVGQENPGEVWVVLVQNGGGKAGDQPKILGQVKAVFAEGVMVSIEKQGNQIIQIIDGQPANIIDVAPSLPTNLSPEFQAMLADKQWTLGADGHIWVTGANGVAQDSFRPDATGETWQARQDVTVGETTYEGWVTDQASTEVATGEIAQMDYVKFSRLGNLDNYTMTVQPGYVEKYKVVQITDGTTTMDLLFLDMKYFYKNGKTLTVSFLADKDLVERGGFNVKNSLGKSYYASLGVPIGDSYSQSDIENGIRVYGFSELASKFYFFGDGSWMKASTSRHKQFTS